MVLNNDNPERLLTEADTASLLGYSPRTLQIWRRQDCGPPCVRFSSRRVRYQYADVIAWAHLHRTKPAGSSGRIGAQKKLPQAHPGVRAPCGGWAGGSGVDG